ncbi:MAG: hypothetical protein AB7S50_06115 [Bacteroidales bacterium]
MKKVVIITGIIGAIFIAIGVLFKTMHWPGAAIAVLIGALALAIYALTYMIEKLKTAGNGIEKTYIVFFGISGIIMCIGFLFKIMHWPGAGVMLYTFFVTYTILVILAIIRAYKEPDKNLQFAYINNLILLIGVMLILTFPTIIRLIN